MPTLRVRSPWHEQDADFEIELTDQQWDAMQAYCRAEQCTLDEFLTLALDRFLSTHPIILQTRSPQ